MGADTDAGAGMAVTAAVTATATPSSPPPPPPLPTRTATSHPPSSSSEPRRPRRRSGARCGPGRALVTLGLAAAVAALGFETALAATPTKSWYSPRFAARIEQERRLLRAAVSRLPSKRPRKGRGRGVLIVGGLCHWPSCPISNSYTLNALVAARQLREVGCRLPIEIFHDGDPMLECPGCAERLRNEAGIRVRDLRLVPKWNQSKTYSVTLVALLNSHFAEVLYIDADNLVLRDPSVLFNHWGYRSSGAMFWPDFFMVNPWSTLWEITDVSSDRLLWTLEVGEMVFNLNDNKTWQALVLTHHMNEERRDLYWRLSRGECELFLFAWLLLDVPFYLVDKPPSLGGEVAKLDREKGEIFCGHTMLHYAPESPKVLFAHRSHDKLVESDGLGYSGVKIFDGLQFPPYVMAGLESPEAWQEMLEDTEHHIQGAMGASLHPEEPWIGARWLGLGVKLTHQKDHLATCTCKDAGKGLPCWDTETELVREGPWVEDLLALLERAHDVALNSLSRLEAPAWLDSWLDDLPRLDGLW